MCRAVQFHNRALLGWVQISLGAHRACRRSVPALSRGRGQVWGEELGMPSNRVRHRPEMAFRG